MFEPGARVIPSESVEAAGQGVPYRPAPPTPPVTRATFGFGWLLVLMACGGAMIAGSFGAWLTVDGRTVSGMSSALSIANISSISWLTRSPITVCRAMVNTSAEHTSTQPAMFEMFAMDKADDMPDTVRPSTVSQAPNEPAIIAPPQAMRTSSQPNPNVARVTGGVGGAGR